MTMMLFSFLIHSNSSLSLGTISVCLEALVGTLWPQEQFVWSSVLTWKLGLVLIWTSRLASVFTDPITLHQHEQYLSRNLDFAFRARMQSAPWECEGPLPVFLFCPLLPVLQDAQDGWQQLCLVFAPETETQPSAKDGESTVCDCGASQSWL